jgi:hypothetical protein
VIQYILGGSQTLCEPPEPYFECRRRMVVAGDHSGFLSLYGS